MTALQIGVAMIGAVAIVLFWLVSEAKTK